MLTSSVKADVLESLAGYAFRPSHVLLHPCRDLVSALEEEDIRLAREVVDNAKSILSTAQRVDVHCHYIDVDEFQRLYRPLWQRTDRSSVLLRECTRNTADISK